MAPPDLRPSDFNVHQKVSDDRFNIDTFPVIVEDDVVYIILNGEFSSLIAALDQANALIDTFGLSQNQIGVGLSPDFLEVIRGDAWGEHPVYKPTIKINIPLKVDGAKFPSIPLAPPMSSWPDVDPSLIKDFTWHNPTKVEVPVPNSQPRNKLVTIFTSILHVK